MLDEKVHCLKKNMLQLVFRKGLFWGLGFFLILFVYDYPKCLKHSNVNIYADDTTQDVPY